MIKKINMFALCSLVFLLTSTLLGILPSFIFVSVAVAADEALEQNIEVLKDKNIDWFKRLQAVQDMGKGKDPRSLPYLIEATLADDNITVRAGAAKALGHMGKPEAVDFLITALKKEKSWIVRSGMVQGLELSGDPRAFTALTLILESDPNVFVRKEAAMSLGKFGDRRAIEPLKKALKDEGVVVHKNQDDDTVTVTRDVVLAAAEALKGFGITVSKKTLAFDWVECEIRRLKKDSDKDKRISAAWRLGMSKSVKAVNPLITALLEDTHVDVRRNAATSLGNLGDRRAVAPLIRAMESDKKYWARICAARALGKLGGKQSIKAIQKAIKDKKISPKALEDTLKKLGIGK